MFQGGAWSDGLGELYRAGNSSANSTSGGNGTSKGNDTSSGDKGKGGSTCFPGTATILTENGPKDMSDLVLGDKVVTVRPGTGLILTEFLGWLDRDSSSIASFLQLQTKGEGNQRLSLTDRHVVFTVSSTGTLQHGFAGDLVPGDRLAYWTEMGLEAREISKITKWKGKSFWAPLTREGTLLVDGFLTSCWAHLPHTTGQILSSIRQLPFHKFLGNILLDNQDSQTHNGLRPIANLGLQLAESIRFGWGKIVNQEERPNIMTQAPKLLNMEGTIIKHVEL